MPNQRGVYLDLPKTSDEVLVLLAREAKNPKARDVLTIRYWTKIKKLIAGWAKTLPLTDREEAQQEGFFWLLEAIEKYNPYQLLQADGCAFRSFLQRKIGARLANFLRGRGRRLRRFQLQKGRFPEPWSLEDRREKLAEFKEWAFAILDFPEYHLLCQRLDVEHLGDLVPSLGSYRTIKRQWQKVCSKLTAALRD